MYTCQFEGLQMGQSNGVLFKKVSGFQRCPLMEVPLYYLFPAIILYYVHG